MDLNLTYEELGERLGVTRNAARVLAQRRKWHRYTSQDDGKARVRVPAEAIADLTHRRAAARAEHVLPHEPWAVHPDGSGVHPGVLPDNRDSRLADMLGLLLDRVAADEAARRDELERLRQDQERLAEERDRLRDELEQARAEADHAKADQVRMARDVAAMFGELRALADRHAELSADRARLEAEAGALRSELNSNGAHIADLKSDLDRERARVAGLEAEVHGARLDTVAAERERAGDQAAWAVAEREVERLRGELEQARRPWWHRLLGR